jgi:protein-L-isoaspartate(D-aspartate) O-methyltransferase
VLDFSPKRQALVQHLKALGVIDPKVLRAMEQVPRHLFVPEEVREAAYENRPLPIGEGQTISQPLMVALCAEALELSGYEKVLEVGTGSGYQAAVLSLLAAEVHTIERLESLHAEAKARLERLGYRNVHCYLGDGTRGLPEAAPFDAALVTAASPSVPAPLLEQLSDGGRLVIPVGGPEGQTLRRVRKGPPGSAPVVEDLMDVRYVPLLGDFGWPKDWLRQ